LIRFVSRAIPAFLLALPALAGSSEYLALGDSVAFGYDPLVAVPIERNYTGYPQILSESAPPLKRLTSLACPGETSGSFLSAAARDNNCRLFKRKFGLHTDYLGTQADYAVQLLTSGKQIKLVTLSIGGNDLLLLQSDCGNVGNVPACIQAQLPAVLQGYAANLTQILTRIRSEARYDGRLVLVTYYSLDYRDPIQTGGIGALNAVAAQVAARFRVTIADGFNAFAQASAASGGDTCAAGLLIALPTGGCDVHPSPKGRDLLAATVRASVPFGH